MLCSKCYSNINLFMSHTNPTRWMQPSSSTFYVAKRRLRDVRQFAQGHQLSVTQVVSLREKLALGFMFCSLLLRAASIGSKSLGSTTH